MIIVIMGMVPVLYSNEMVDFQIGDVVVKRYGNKPVIIMGNGIAPTSQVKAAFYAKSNEIIPYDPLEVEPMADTKTLYTFKKSDGSTVYGHHIGTNSSNNYLIEEKGTGEIHVMKPDEVEEVLPYTFSASINGKETHYVCQPDAIKKGDFLLYTQGSQPMIAVVTAVDTKNKSARSKFRGKRLLLEDL